MPGHRYGEEIGSAAFLAIKRLAGVTLEMNSNKWVTHMGLLGMNIAAHSGFQTHQPIAGMCKGLITPVVFRRKLLRELFTKLWVAL